MPNPLMTPPRLLLALTIALLLSACAKETPPAVIVATDVSCKSFRKIGWSVLDTVETVDQVRRHNARYLTICRKRTLK